LDSVEDVAKLADDHEVWEIVGYYLGIMCANLTLTLSVEKIVIGGGVTMRGEVLMQKIRSNFLKAINGYLKH
jgi:fructokinase